jgi:catechol 2,3-dioxygenase
MNSYQPPADTHIGHVHLQTANPDSLLRFYIDLLGFKELKREGSSVFLGAGENKPLLIVITENPDVKPLNRFSPGLFHTAFLLPSRFALAQLLHRLVENNIRLGFGDHGVSEALYLADPDGNGVELYADRPREMWPVKNGKIEMYTAPVDTKSLLHELSLQPHSWNGIHPDTTIGHIHLQVSDLKKASTFYNQIIGFDITQQSYPGALFVSAGGYHHHIGLNTWNSRNSPPAEQPTTGLVSYSIVVPGKETLDILNNRLNAAGITTKKLENGLQASDFDQIMVELINL